MRLLCLLTACVSLLVACAPVVHLHNPATGDVRECGSRLDLLGDNSSPRQKARCVKDYQAHGYVRD